MIASEKDLVSLGRTLPTTNPCLSYWQRTTRAFPLLNSHHDTRVPERSGYVIIGSGLSGSLTAFSLIEQGVAGSDIVILEAREAASGASSRNAGHVRPDSFRGFSAYSKVHGPDQALKIIQNERLVLEKVDEFVKQHKVDCDFHYTTTFDVCMTQEFADYMVESFEAFKNAGGDVSHVRLLEGEEAKRRTRVPGAICAYQWPAGSSHPAKLTQFLLKSVTQSGAKLFTHCPALDVSAAPSNEWKIATPRGDIITPTVIHCTNAHTSYLLPQLSRHVTPNRAQAHTIIPNLSFSGSNILPSTYSLRYSLRHFYSLIQRQDDGVLVLGISRTNPNLSAKTRAGTLSTDDSFYSEEMCQDALTNFETIFKQITPDEQKAEESNEYHSTAAHGEGLDHAWSGIIAMTSDSVPFVGAVEGMPGQWIIGGHNGHGMARIFTCAPGLARLIQGGTWEDTGLPECFQMNKKRLERLNGGVKAGVW